MRTQLFIRNVGVYLWKIYSKLVSFRQFLKIQMKVSRYILQKILSKWYKYNADKLLR